MSEDEKKLCTELWDIYKEPIHRVCSVKLRSCPCEIEDVVSEVFYALCKKVAESGPPEKPREWLYGTLKNLLNKKYRGLYLIRENETVFAESEIELPYKQDDISLKETEIYIEELMKVIEDILNDEEIELINHIYYSRLKHKEIADMKNTTESAIKQKHYRINLKLRKAAKKLAK